VSPGQFIAVLGGIATLIGAGAGLWKLIADGRTVKDERPLRTYRELSLDLRAELEAVQEDRKHDREVYQADKLLLDSRLSNLEQLVSRYQSQITKLVGHIRYLRRLLATHAPDVAIDPIPDIDYEEK
jgi:hypothetical protein